MQALLVPDLAAEAYDGLAPAYDTFTAGHEYVRWLDYLEDLAVEHGLSGKALLDVGCGTGKSFSRCWTGATRWSRAISHRRWSRGHARRSPRAAHSYLSPICATCLNLAPLTSSHVLTTPSTTRPRGSSFARRSWGSPGTCGPARSRSSTPTRCRRTAR